jgi:dihydropteroate synthase
MNASTDEKELSGPCPGRAISWQLRTKTITCGRMPRIMGILNATPDSFSDGGQFFEPAAAIEHGLRLIAEGADFIDVGGESTRPYSTPVSEAEELRRVIPVIRALVEQSSIPVSIDTSKAAVAQEAIAAGAEVINDVTGLTGDPCMLAVALQSGAGVCAMHMRGTPQTMQDDPRYEDVVREVRDYLVQRRDALFQAGIEPDRICLDPGIGFGKTHAHSLELMRACASFHSLGRPLLVGHSRKSFINHVLRDKQAHRVWGTVGATLALARHGVQIIRVHDVRANCDALRLFEAAGGLD